MEFTIDQATAAAEAAGIDLKKERFTAEALAAGMTAELEHGAESPDTDITNNDPILTAKLAVAHLRKSPFYYAPKKGLKAWEASLGKGVKTKSMKTEYKVLQFKADEYEEDTGIFSGYAAVFGSASNTLLAPALIGAEVFGWAGAPAFLAACAAAYVVNGNRSIYSGQRA